MRERRFSSLYPIEFKGEKLISTCGRDKSAKDPDIPTTDAALSKSLTSQSKKNDKRFFTTVEKSSTCVVIEGNGRDLSLIHDGSIDCIITDHPWKDEKAHTGGTRHFAAYDCFKYTIEDFKEKSRVLKDGSFLVEMIPAENESNYEYLYELKQMAKEAGLLYYSKVLWKKGSFVSNTGRKSKNTQDIMIFSKGKARALRLDTKKILNTCELCYMSGTNGMLPTMFDVQPVKKKDQIHKSETPVDLWLQVIEYISKEGETILDQFAGSGSLGEAALLKNRNCILIESSPAYVKKIEARLSSKGFLSIARTKEDC